MKLHQYPEAFGLPSASPFCVKVATYLRMVEQPYEVVLGDPRRAPKGKLPLLEHEGKLIADSDFIVRYLSSLGLDLDAHLQSEERARSTAIRRMIEEHLYWAMVYSRFIDEPSWTHSRDLLLKDFPFGLRHFFGLLFQREVRSSLRGHGMGRHSRDEIYQLGHFDLEQLSSLLGDSAYFMGARPSAVDATAYAFLACILLPKMKTPLTEKVLELQNLSDYVERLRLEYYAS